MTDAAYLKAHDAGLEVMGRGTGVPINLCALADWLESSLGEGVAPDKLLAALGHLLLDQRAQNAGILELAEKLRTATANQSILRQDRTDLDSELRECREALAEWQERATRAESLLGRTMGELGGLTLSQLPRGGYGAMLLSCYAEYKESGE